MIKDIYFSGELMKKRYYFTFAIALTLIPFFQNCDNSFKPAENIELSSAAPSNVNLALSGQLSSDAVVNKFGYIDAPSHAGLNALTRARFEKFQTDVKAGIRIYNFWFSNIEPNFVGSQSQYVASASLNSCPSGTEVYPSGGNLGRFHFFRCVNTTEINKFKELFQFDKVNGVKSIISIYGTPEQYRPVDCKGSDGFVRLNNTNVHVWGCPIEDLNQFEDFVRIYAKEIGNLVLDYSLWNENNSDGWFYISSNQDRVEKYFQMMKIVDKVMKEENVANYRLYVSLDFNWTVRPESGISGFDFLTQLWNKPNIAEIPWSLNLHPYTDEHAQDPNGFPFDDRSLNHGDSFYGFSNLQKVFDFQKRQLTSRGLPDSAIQSKALLGEQGWYINNNNAGNVAIEICKAQNIMNANSNIIGAAYNTLLRTGDGSQDGLGLLPERFFNRLEDLSYESESTYQAMKSTHPEVWGKRSNHFCCERAYVGCRTTPPPTPTPMPTVIPIQIPVNGGWTDYLNQGTCSKSCGRGLQNQIRSCTNPAPALGGAQCSGSNSRQIECNTQACISEPSTPLVCTGSIPTNATLCSGDGADLTLRSSNKIVSLCTAATKCEYTCNPDFMLSGGTCRPAPRPLIGYLDEVKKEGESLKILGWACQRGSEQSVNVEVLVNGPQGSGRFVLSGKADRRSEENIRIECGGNSLLRRFELSLQGSMLNQVYGKKVYVYGINPTNRQSKTLLANSGIFAPDAPLTCNGMNISGRCLDVKKVTTTVGGVAGQTGKWWCDNHFGKNLGGVWTCLGNRCSIRLRTNEVVQCAK